MTGLLIEAHSGISGDMFVAAAAALAGCEDEVCDLPGKLGLEGVTCRFRNVVRASIQCRKFDVMEGEIPAEDAAQAHCHQHGHSHHHPHRSLSSIRAMIIAAGIEPAVEERALRMFDRLGEVEAATHGIPVEHVHFHEIGAVDSIIDIVAAALCIQRLQRLGVGAVFATPICVGSGTVNTAHGILPVPAPATERLLRGMPTTAGELPGEWTTPTGALIVAELGANFEIPPLLTKDAALGGGTRNPAKRPSVLRLRLAEIGAKLGSSNASGGAA